MSNQLAMDKVQSIKSLASSGMSERRIARTLGISRKAVRRHLAGETSKDTKAPTGSEGCETPAAPRSRSACAGLQSIILAKLEQGLTAQRIHQDLVAEDGFPGAYPSLRRFVARLKGHRPLPFRRMEVAAGEEAQIDFGTGALLLLAVVARPMFFGSC